MGAQHGMAPGPRGWQAWRCGRVVIDDRVRCRRADGRWRVRCKQVQIFAHASGPDPYVDRSSSRIRAGRVGISCEEARGGCSLCLDCHCRLLRVTHGTARLKLAVEGCRVTPATLLALFYRIQRGLGTMVASRQFEELPLRSVATNFSNSSSVFRAWGDHGPIAATGSSGEGTLLPGTAARVMRFHQLPGPIRAVAGPELLHGCRRACYVAH